MIVLRIFDLKVAEVDYDETTCLVMVVAQRVRNNLVENLLVCTEVNADLVWDRVQFSDHDLNLEICALDQEWFQEVLHYAVHRICRLLLEIDNQRLIFDFDPTNLGLL